MNTPAQYLEVQKLLKWFRVRLAARSKIPAERLRLLEIGPRALSPEGCASIERALEAAGEEYTDGDPPGMRMRKRARACLPRASRQARAT
jgi:hypothetical protein